jgi:phosphate-selective porin OprO/OprP
MKSLTKIFAAALLASTSSAAMAADEYTRIGELETQVQALSKQIQALKASAQQEKAAMQAAVQQQQTAFQQQQAAIQQQQVAVQQQQQAAIQQQQVEITQQQAEVKKQQASAAKPTITNGRLSVSSADGSFTAAVRALVQADMGYYMQSATGTSLPSNYGPDLSSGANLRRVFLGLQGKVFNDWSYYFLYDFGGASTETQGHIMYAYLQYDGLAPWAFRVGAYAPPVNIEDSTASSDLMFFERNSPSNLQRNIAGAEGRDAISIMYIGDRLFGALSLSGNKVSDGAKALAAAGATAVPNFDEQVSLLGRLSYLPISTDEAHWLVGVNGTYVIKLPDLARSGAASLSTTPGAAAAHTVSLGDLPEIAIDSNGINLVTTGALGADHVSQWGVETAGNFRNFYGQAGYYSYAVHRTPQAYTVFSNAGVSAPAVVQPSSNTFSGWYIQGSWILTGESKTYSKATSSFGAPVPAKPFSLKDGGWGAFEVAARFSDLNLNSHTMDSANVITDWTATKQSYTYYNTVRGGDQRILTLALNWYPTAVVRVALDYQLIDVSRLQTPTVVSTAGTPAIPALNGGQTVQTIALRVQLSI